jgi:hypothetical protein
VNAEPAAVGIAPVARTAPAAPRPAGVVDLGRYRGRVAAASAVLPPPRPDALEPVLDGSGLPLPTPVPPALGFERGEVVIRRLRLGSVLRMAFGLSLCIFVGVGAGALIWLTISTLGGVENLGSFAEHLG